MTIANREQADKWNEGDDAGHWVVNQARYDAMLAPFADMLLDTSALQPDERVLDVGCGCGATTLAAARSVPRGEAVGIDLSHPMLERARAAASAAGIGNALFEAGDAQVHPFGRSTFDAIISRFGTMFFGDTVAALSNLRAAARPDGRLTFVCWQPFAANEWLVLPGGTLAEHVELPELGPPDAPGMFALADPERTRRLLAEAGWRQIGITSVHSPLLVGGGGTLDDTLEFLRTGSLGRSLLASAPPDAAARALGALREALAPHVDSSGLRLDSAVWLVQARA